MCSVPLFPFLLSFYHLFLRLWLAVVSSFASLFLSWHHEANAHLQLLLERCKSSLQVLLAVKVWETKVKTPSIIGQTCRKKRRRKQPRGSGGMRLSRARPCLLLQRKLSLSGFFKTSPFLSFPLIGRASLLKFSHSLLVFPSSLPLSLHLLFKTRFPFFSVCACFRPHPKYLFFLTSPSSFSSSLMIASLSPSQIFLTFSSYTPLFIVLVIFLPLRLSMHLLHSSFIFSL